MAGGHGCGVRIAIIGTSGSGKTTLAVKASRRLSVPHIELDRIHHGPGWTPTPKDEFRRQVSALVAQESWVLDGNYGAVRDIVWARATTIVWVDPPLAVVMAQVVWRSFIRAATQQELWNGNRESFRAWLDPEHPIRWAWNTHARRQAEYSAAAGSHWIRLRSRGAINAWLQTLAAPPSG